MTTNTAVKIVAGTVATLAVANVANAVIFVHRFNKATSTKTK